MLCPLRRCDRWGGYWCWCWCRVTWEWCWDRKEVKCKLMSHLSWWPLHEAGFFKWGEDWNAVDPNTLTTALSHLICPDCQEYPVLSSSDVEKMLTWLLDTNYTWCEDMNWCDMPKQWCINTARLKLSNTQMPLTTNERRHFLPNKKQIVPQSQLWQE